jgi:hypothetical protein
MRLEHSGLRARPLTKDTAACWLAIAMLALVGCNWQRGDRDARPSLQPTALESAAEPVAKGSPTAVPATESPAGTSPWGTDLEAALADAKRLGRPVLVVSILGDLAKRC